MAGKTGETMVAAQRARARAVDRTGYDVKQFPIEWMGTSSGTYYINFIVKLNVKRSAWRNNATARHRRKHSLCVVFLRMFTGAVPWIEWRMLMVLALAASSHCREFRVESSWLSWMGFVQICVVYIVYTIVHYISIYCICISEAFCFVLSPALNSRIQIIAFSFVNIIQLRLINRRQRNRNQLAQLNVASC